MDCSPCQTEFDPAASHRIAARGRPGARAAKARGYTMVELMVVMVIVGLMGVVVVLTAPDGSAVLAREADHFGGRLLRAREEAILGTRAVAVTVTARGYDFSRQSFGQWQPLEDGPFGHVAWEDGTRPVLERGRQQLTFEFDPTGVARVEALTLERDGQQMEVSVDVAARIRIDELQR